MNEGELVQQRPADAATQEDQPRVTNPAPTARLRWLRLTSDRLVIGLMFLEVLLWLSERFQWFGFNQHKGWTVLVGVACVGVFLFLMLLWFIGALLLRWRFQFGIRALLLLTVAAAISCSWLVTEMRAARRQREAVEAIKRLGGWVHYDSDLSGNRNPQPPAWLRSVLGEDFFATVHNVVLEETGITDGDLENLKGLNQFGSLLLQGTQVSDAGLEHLSGLTELRCLTLTRTKVTDDGVKKLQQALPKCEIYH